MENSRKRSNRIASHDNGKKLIDYLSEKFKYYPKNEWKRFILDKRIQINSLNTFPDKTILTGDIISFFPPEIIEPEINRNFEICYQDRDIFVVNKPQNLPVHPAGRYQKNTLISIMKDEFGKLFPVNRLDRETSGLLILARSEESARYYSNELIFNKIRKEYIAIVHGLFPVEYIAKGSIINDKNSPIRKKMKFIENDNVGKSTETQFKLREHLKNNKSKIMAVLTTGRTHQIRATLEAMGYPIVGDKMYGKNPLLFDKFINGKLLKEDKDLLFYENQALHSSKILFTNRENKNIIIEKNENFT